MSRRPMPATPSEYMRYERAYDNAAVRDLGLVVHTRGRLRMLEGRETTDLAHGFILTVWAPDDFSVELNQGGALLWSASYASKAGAVDHYDRLRKAMWPHLGAWRYEEDRTVVLAEVLAVVNA